MKGKPRRRMKSGSKNRAHNGGRMPKKTQGRQNVASSNRKGEVGKKRLLMGNDGLACWGAQIA